MAGGRDRFMFNDIKSQAYVEEGEKIGFGLGTGEGKQSGGGKGKRSEGWKRRVKTRRGGGGGPKEFLKARGGGGALKVGRNMVGPRVGRDGGQMGSSGNKNTRGKLRTKNDRRCSEC